MIEKKTVKDFKPGDVVTWDMNDPSSQDWYDKHGFGPFDVVRVDDAYVYIKYGYKPGDGGFYPYSLFKLFSR